MIIVTFIAHKHLNFITSVKYFIPCSQFHCYVAKTDIEYHNNYAHDIIVTLTHP